MSRFFQAKLSRVWNPPFCFYSDKKVFHRKEIIGMDTKVWSDSNCIGHEDRSFRWALLSNSYVQGNSIRSQFYFLTRTTRKNAKISFYFSHVRDILRVSR